MAKTPQTLRFTVVLAWMTCILALVTSAALTAVSIILVTLGAVILADRMTLLLVMSSLNVAALLAFTITSAVFLCQLHGRQALSPRHRTAALLIGTIMILASSAFSYVALGLEPWRYDSRGGAIDVATFRFVGLALASTFLVAGLLFYSVSHSPSRPDQDPWTGTEAEVTHDSELHESPRMKRDVPRPFPPTPTTGDPRVFGPLAKRAASAQIFVKPMNSRTRLVSRESTQSTHTTDSDLTIATRTDDGSHSWQVGVTEHPGDQPRSYVMTRLDPIPASAPVSPAKRPELLPGGSPPRKIALTSGLDDADGELAPRTTPRCDTLDGEQRYPRRATPPGGPVDEGQRSASRASMTQSADLIGRRRTTRSHESGVKSFEVDPEERITTRSPPPHLSDADESLQAVGQASSIRFPPPRRPTATFHLPRPFLGPSTSDSPLPSPALSMTSVCSATFSTPLETPSTLQSPEFVHHSQSLAALNGEQGHIHPLFRTTSLNREPIPKITTPNTVVHASPWGGQTIKSPSDQTALGLTLVSARLSLPHVEDPDTWPLPATTSPLLASTYSTHDLRSQPQLRSHRIASQALHAHQAAAQPLRPAVLARRDINVDAGRLPRAPSPPFSIGPSHVLGLGITHSLLDYDDEDDDGHYRPAVPKKNARPALRSTKSAADVSPEKKSARLDRADSLAMPKANMPPPPSPGYLTPTFGTGVSGMMVTPPMTPVFGANQAGPGRRTGFF